MPRLSPADGIAENAKQTLQVDEKRNVVRVNLEHGIRLEIGTRTIRLHVVGARLVENRGEIRSKKVDERGENAGIALNVRVAVGKYAGIVVGVVVAHGVALKVCVGETETIESVEWESNPHSHRGASFHLDHRHYLRSTSGEPYYARAYPRLGGLRGEAGLREELRANLGEAVESRVRIGNASLRSSTLALRHADLAVDLLDLLRQRVTEQILLQLRDRLNRPRPATRALRVVGASGGTVVGGIRHD